MFYYFSVAIFACVFYIMYYHPKKLPWHIITDLLFEAHFQITGAGGLIDDLVQKRRNRLPELPLRANQVAIVTGGARGIGTEIVKKLLQCDMTVVIGVRRLSSAKKFIQTVQKKENIIIMELDVSSLKSVKTFCERIESQFQHINLLVNNAGIMFGDFKLTDDGFENQLATNYLGHFYLTHLLLPQLKKGTLQADNASRVVNVTSCAHFPAKIHFDDINSVKRYYSSRAYAQSKLAQIMFARHLNNILNENTDKVLSFSVHPGIVNTDLFENTYFRNYFPALMDIFFKTPEKGATSIVYSCIAPELEIKGGIYVSNCGEGYSNSFSKNKLHQENLFKISCDMIGIKENLYGYKTK